MVRVPALEVDSGLSTRYTSYYNKTNIDVIPNYRVKQSPDQIRGDVFLAFEYSDCLSNKAFRRRPHCR